jgi:hypothetical protein
VAKLSVQCLSRPQGAGQCVQALREQLMDE